MSHGHHQTSNAYTGRRELRNRDNGFCSDCCRRVSVTSSNHVHRLQNTNVQPRENNNNNHNHNNNSYHHLPFHPIIYLLLSLFIHFFVCSSIHPSIHSHYRYTYSFLDGHYFRDILKYTNVYYYYYYYYYYYSRVSKTTYYGIFYVEELQKGPS
jgi:hypothetical protein